MADPGEIVRSGATAGGGRELSVRVPGDKSITQRALILGALAEGESRIGGALRGADPLATGRALAALGVQITCLEGSADDDLRIRGRGLRGWRQPNAVLDLRNSGTGARLLAGALAPQPLDAVLAGDKSLSARPMERIAAPLRRMGAGIEYPELPGRLPMRIGGAPLTPLRHESAVSSAQVKGAVLLAGVGAEVAVEVSEPRRSRDHSERMLESMGVDVVERAVAGRWSVRVPAPPPRLAPLDMRVPGDFSSAAFLLVWAALAGGRDALTVRAVGLNGTRTGLLSVLARMGVAVEVVPRETAGGEPVGDLRVGALAGPPQAVEVGGDEIPAMIDEVPVLAVLAARAEGVTRIAGARELRVKESDRLAALAVTLRRIGVAVEELPDGLDIEGTRDRLSGVAECFRDHRIAMAFGVLGATPGCDVRVDDPGTSDVSFPGFWKLLASLRRRSETARGGRAAAANSGSAPEGDGAAPGRACLVVAIDGSAGSGKSTTAAAVAARLGFRHLDSGAIYRAVTLGLLEVRPGDAAPHRVTPAELAALAIDLKWLGGRAEVWALGDRIRDEDLRSERVTALVSRVSAIPAVRACLLDLQRSAAAGPGLVAEGRDMGSVVFPKAEVKVYLDADPRERARRRILQRGTRSPGPAEIETEAARLGRRDERDSSRSVAPMRRAEDAVVIDTTGLDPAEQIDRIVRLARDARRASR